MLASKALVLVLAVAACEAVPVWVGDGWYSDRSPRVSFEFGTDVHGVRRNRHFSQSGHGRAVGAGFSSAGGDAHAQSIGVAESGPTYNTQPRPLFQPIYNNFGSASSSSRNYGAGSSSARSHSNVQYPAMRALPLPVYSTAVSSAQSWRFPEYDTAVSAVRVGHEPQYGPAESVNSSNDYGASHDGTSDYVSALSYALNDNGVHAGAAEAVQRSDGLLQQSGATSINAPGFQAAHAHSVNSDAYYH